MSNNMDLGYDMFCYQCEQTAGGKGCTKLGVCVAWQCADACY